MDDDIHICGSCKGQFTNLDEFITHKRQCKARAELTAKASSVHVSAPTSVSSPDALPGSTQQGIRKPNNQSSVQYASIR